MYGEEFKGAKEIQLYNLRLKFAIKIWNYCAVDQHQLSNGVRTLIILWQAISFIIFARVQIVCMVI